MGGGGGVKLRRSTAFYLQPWFWTLAIVVGQYYGVWWQSLGKAAPVYVSPRVFLASNDAFNVVVTAPGLRPARAELRAAN